MIGYFVNEVILRTFVTRTMTCAELLDQVRKVCFAAYTHQDVPFEYLESVLNDDGSKSVPLCQVMFNYRNFPIPSQEFDGITLASWDGQNRSMDPGIMISRVVMIINLRDMSTKLTGAVNFKTDLFTDDDIAALLTLFEKILWFIIRRPECTLAYCAFDVGWEGN